MRRHMSLILSLLLLTSTLSWAADTSSRQRRVRPSKTMQIPKSTTPTSSTPQPSAEQLAAQDWLKSIGYDLTLEQMKTQKRLVLQKYSLQTVNLITDANMIHVKQLPNLEDLRVLDTSITRSGTGLRSVRSTVDVQRTIISDSISMGIYSFRSDVSLTSFTLVTGGTNSTNKLKRR